MTVSAERKRLCTCLLMVNLAFIWGNSLLPGQYSGAISDWVKDLLAALFLGDELPEVDGGHLIRKLAHFTEFACLGALLSWYFGMRGKGFPWPVLWGGAAACMDETIQRFVPDRGPSVWDAALDTCGIVIGMILFFLGHHYLRHRGEKNPTKENL